MEELTERCLLYQELLAVSQECLALCKNDNLADEPSQAKLSKFLQQRQELISKISLINEDKDSNQIGKLSTVEKRTVEQIIKIDQQCTDIITMQKQQLSEKLSKIRDGKRTTKAYQPSIIQSEGYFIDNKK